MCSPSLPIFDRDGAAFASSNCPWGKKSVLCFSLYTYLQFLHREPIGHCQNLVLQQPKYFNRNSRLCSSLFHTYVLQYSTLIMAQNNNDPSQNLIMKSLHFIIFTAKSQESSDSRSPPLETGKDFFILECSGHNQFTFHNVST